MPIFEKTKRNKNNTRYKFTSGMNTKNIGFKKTLNYIAGLDGKHPSNTITDVTMLNCPVPLERAYQYFEAVADTYTGVPTELREHYVISYNPGEEVTAEQAKNAVNRTLEILGYENCPLYTVFTETTKPFIYISVPAVQKV